MTLLIVTAVGAGLLAGWQWWTFLLLPAAAIGFFHLSESLYDSGVECSPYHPAVAYGLFLVPVAVGVGALANRLAHAEHGAHAVGTILVLAPLVIFGWAGLRHTFPIDRHPAQAFLPAPPSRPSYRGLKIGDTKERMFSLLGQPESTAHGTDYAYGADTVMLSSRSQGVFNEKGTVTWNGVEMMSIRNSRAETPEGVGIGDSLAVFKRYYPGRWCGVLRHLPGCEIDMRYAYIEFEGDPIDSIVLLASGTKGRG